MIVRPVSDSVRRTTASVSANVRRKTASIARRAVHHCAPVHVGDYLEARPGVLPTLPYLHVRRDEEVDYRTLYSEFLARSLTHGGAMLDFSMFRAAAAAYLANKSG